MIIMLYTKIISQAYNYNYKDSGLHYTIVYKQIYRTRIFNKKKWCNNMQIFKTFLVGWLVIIFINKRFKWKNGAFQAWTKVDNSFFFKVTFIYYKLCILCKYFNQLEYVLETKIKQYQWWEYERFLSYLVGF